MRETASMSLIVKCINNFCNIGLNCMMQWFSFGGSFSLGYLKMTGDISSCHTGECYWLFVGRCQGAAKYLTMQRTAPLIKNGLTPNVTSARLRNPAVGLGSKVEITTWMNFILNNSI